MQEAKDAVEKEKERLLETEPGTWPAIIKRREAEGKPVNVRAPRSQGSEGGEEAEGRHWKIPEESDRGLGATLLGGAAGAYAGEHVGKGGLVGSVTGALLGALGGRVAGKA